MAGRKIHRDWLSRTLNTADCVVIAFERQMTDLLILNMKRKFP